MAGISFELRRFLSSVEDVGTFDLDRLGRLLTYGGFRQDPARVQRFLREERCRPQGVHMDRGPSDRPLSRRQPRARAC